MFNKEIARDYIDIIKKDPDLYYKDRVTVRCIRSNPSANVYKVGDTLDYANV